ncbi:MAG: transposase [Tepidisphaeraceae bacterium]
MRIPPGYHITWGTYGMRLPGSEKPHVTKIQNEYGTSLPEANQWDEADALQRMTQGPVRLTIDQRHCVEDAIAELASRYEWTIHAITPQSDHVHVVITAARVGPELREALKAVTSRQLNKRFGKQKWWAEGGSCKYLYEPDYFRNAISYVQRQRDW